MKSQDLKKVLKPLIKECVKEMMIEDGFLSSVVSEVLKGMNASVIVESKAPPQKREAASREKEWEKGLADKMEAERQERIKKLNETMTSKHNTDVFEGVSAIPDDPSASTAAGSSPLSGGSWPSAISRGPSSSPPDSIAVGASSTRRSPVKGCGASLVGCWSRSWGTCTAWVMRHVCGTTPSRRSW